MLAEIIEDSRSELITIDPAGQKVRFFGQEAILTVKEDSAVLNEGSGVRIDLLQKGSDLYRLSFRKQFSCMILIRRREGWNHFSAYRLKEMITVGSGSDDDVFLPDLRLRPHQVILDCRRGKITDRLESGFLSDNGTIIREENLDKGHVYAILGVRIVYGGSFISISRIEGMRTSLAPFKAEKLKRKAENQHTFLRNVPKLHTAPDRRFAEQLEEPEPIPQDHMPPLLFTIGPSITMSSASFLSAWINLNNSLDAGREIREVLPVMILPAAMMLSTLLWIPGQRLYVRLERNRKLRSRMNSYSEYLGDLEDRIRLLQERWKEEASARWPADFYRMMLWQKEGEDRDLYTARGGSGDVDFEIELTRSFRLRSNDVLSRRLEELPDRVRIVKNMPVLLDMKQYGHVRFRGVTDRLWLLFFLQVIHHVSPEQLKVFFFCSESWEQEHFWIRLLPHCRYQSERFIVNSQNEVRSYTELADDYDILCIVQDVDLAGMIPFSNAMIWQICGSEKARKEGETLISEEDGMISVKDGKSAFSFQCEMELPPDLNAYVYEMGAECEKRNDRQNSCTFFDLMDINDVRQLDIAANWSASSIGGSIRGYLGFDRKGERIVLDVHEAGMGPHGLVAGMTGSGKSELLISFLLSLAVRYSPRDISFILMDFKGGGLIQSLTADREMIPHIAGILTDLDENDMKRVLVSFGNECRRRERLMQRASALSGSPIMNIDSYRNSWNESDGLPYLPHLIILADEFAQMKKSNPEFLSELISIARIGRSLGIHLILSTQKPSGVIDDQIWSNCRFRICLKVQDRQDSSEVLHSPDAFELRRPGDFILQYDQRTRTGRGGYTGCSVNEQTAETGLIMANGDYVPAEHHHPLNKVTQAAAIVGGLIKTGKQTGMKAEKIWLDPPDLPGTEEAGKTEGMMAGIADDYENGTQPPVFFSARPPGIAVISSYRSQKTALIRALVWQLVRTRPDDELCLLDENEISESWVQECTQIIARGSAADEELWNGMIRHIRLRSDKECTVWIIMTDYSAVKEAEDDKSLILHQLMESADKLNIRFVLCGMSASVFLYRHISLFSERFCLRNSNRSDISQFFEMSGVPACEKDGYGLYAGRKLLSFAFLRVSEDELCEMCRRKKRKRTFMIPRMPVSLSLKQYQGSGIPAGMDYETCRWCIVPGDKKLLFLATYYRELEGLVRAYRENGYHVRVNEDTGIREGEVCFMTLDQWMRSSFKNHMEDVFAVYIGSGFHDQYQFSARRKKIMRPNEGMILYEGRNEVIRVAEPDQAETDHSVSGCQQEIL